MAKLGEHAVVLGASMGGLLAARVLADFYANVTVVERDVLPNDPANRRGVPQGRHAHGLLRRGGQIIDELFPGFLNELVAAGAPVLDDGDFSKIWMSVGGHQLVRVGKVRDQRAMTIYVPSRPFLECHVRRRLSAIPNVTILSGLDAAEMTAPADRNRVTGVRVVNRDSGAEQELTKFFRVNNFIDPPVRLLHPSFISRVAAVNLRRRRGDYAALAAAAAR